VSVPVHKRRIGYDFQDARLSPHLTVRKKLDYRRSRKNTMALTAA
jgi:molybdate transport system ATP-binding protein